MRVSPARLLVAAALLLGPGLPVTASVASAEQPAATEACPAADHQPLSLPATRAALEAGRPLTIVAFGSSSTEGAGASGPERTYPAQLEARLHATLPGRTVTVLNRGVGGQEVGEMLARLEGDVIARRPNLVIWQAGANAVLKGMDPGAFRAALAGGLARLQAAGAEVVLMDSQRAPRILAAPRHALFDAAMQELAATQHLPLFSRAELMRDWVEAGVPNEAMLHTDGLHHNDRGYRCVAAALADSILGALRPAPVMAAGR